MIRNLFILIVMAIIIFEIENTAFAEDYLNVSSEEHGNENSEDLSVIKEKKH